MQGVIDQDVFQKKSEQFPTVFQNLTTYRAKLLNADWLKQGALSINQEGLIFYFSCIEEQFIAF